MCDPHRVDPLRTPTFGVVTDGLHGASCNSCIEMQPADTPLVHMRIYNMNIRLCTQCAGVAATGLALCVKKIAKSEKRDGRL